MAAELHQIAADLGIEGHRGLKKADLVEKILAHTNGERSTPAPAATTSPPPEAAPAAQQAATDAFVDVREPSGNGDTRQRTREDRPHEERPRDDRRGGRPDGGQQRDREGGPRRRPSREERRRQREERRQR